MCSATVSDQGNSPEEDDPTDESIDSCSGVLKDSGETEDEDLPVAVGGEG